MNIKEFIQTYKGKAALWNPKNVTDISKLPYSIRVLLENMLRNYDGEVVTEEHVKAVANWKANIGKEIPYMPSRVILQDLTGVPAVVDLAAMRDAMKEMGGDPRKVDSLVEADLIIDHSVAVDYFGTSYALALNMKNEIERNRERYCLLKWAQKAFRNFHVIPPGKGIIHQINLEYLAKVVHLKEFRGELSAYPDTVIGTDSHTTMIAGMGVLGWGVGGIEAEAVMLGQPCYITIPEVVGVELVGELPEGVTATDLVLTVTERLRKKGVVGKIVEYFGDGISKLSVPDRAVLANMAPEYGATTGFFPVDGATLEYLRMIGKPEEHVRLVEEYTKRVGLFYDGGRPEYSDVITINMSEVEPCIAGPSNPEDRIPLSKVKGRITDIIRAYIEEMRKRKAEPAEYFEAEFDGLRAKLGHGFIAIAAITSCTNTSNPSLLVGAGLLAKKAVERGLTVKPWVKTSFAPGSTTVPEYLKRLGLLPYLEALRFHVVGFGCTTCIGNSGPLVKQAEEAIKEGVYAVSVLSGNRNFEGRIHPLVRGNFLASPILVVAYALAGRIDIDFEKEPIGLDPNGRPVYLKDIWPSRDEIKKALESAPMSEVFREKCAEMERGIEEWEKLEAPATELYQWDPNSTHIRRPPFFEGMGPEPEPLNDIKGARALVLLGDRITTDHISPASSIPADSPAAKYLMERGVKPEDLGSYGERRGNYEVMMRGTFANIRLKNFLTPDREGGWTLHLPDGQVMSIFDASEKYKKEGVPLVVLGGRQYGAGSSRDWAAKGPYLLGVKAVIAEDFERIHRSNLVEMGILPLQFLEGQGWRQLGLTGREEFDVLGIKDGLWPGKRLKVVAKREDGSKVEFEVTARLDSKIEVEYYRHGGILKYVLRKLLKS